MSESLFDKDKAMIKLTDDDFQFKKNPDGSLAIKVINPKFKNKHGYVMFFASWCPHCQAKKDFWCYLAKQFNVNPQYSKENFRIGCVDAENPLAASIIKALGIGPIPQFFHVFPDGSLEKYQGQDLDPSSLINEVCSLDPQQHLCQMELSSLQPPPFH